VRIVLDPPITGLNGPIGLTHAGDARLFVVEQTGRARIISDSVALAMPFLDVSALISTGFDRGLLGLAFDPQYAANGNFYVYYTDVADHGVLARYSRSAVDPNQADPASAVVLLTVDHPQSTIHWGGQLAFGPDGYLYLGTGDGGPVGDPFDNAQNRGVVLGKLLRLDVHAPPPTPYAIPTTNPFYGQANVRWEIWDWGLRNPWRFSFDRQTGDLFIGDVGNLLWEEVDFEPAGSAGGSNYGWRLWEGRHCFEPASDCTPTPGATPFYPMVTPVVEIPHATSVPDNACAVIGGYVYRGTQQPSLVGTYFFADYCNGRIWGLSPEGPQAWQAAPLLMTRTGLTSFGEGADGELYVLGYGGVRHIREATQRVYLPAVSR
jgi:glucose/arabinose dehydrogenase